MKMVEKLTDRELECLRLAAKDYNIYQSAEIMSLSYETVKWYRKNIIQKLGCKSIVGAVAIAVRGDCPLNFN